MPPRDSAQLTLPLELGALEQRLRAAAVRRQALARAEDTNAFRLVHAEGDGVPGVSIDVYDAWFVLSLVDTALPHQELILEAAQRLGPRGIYLKLPPKAASLLVDPRRDDIAPAHAVRGEAAPAPLWVLEHGLRFEVRLGDGLSTGLFLDQRANRQLVRAMAQGRSVLNLFAYTGSFTVAAIAGGAARTVTVDISRKVLDWAARNVALLRSVARSTEPARPIGAEASAADAALADAALEADAHRLLRADVLDWLRRASKRRDRYDLVVLDPPSFSTTKRSRFSAAQDYRALAAAALRCVAPGGHLLACTNHRGIRPAALTRELQAAAADADCTLTEQTLLADPIDFPSPPGADCHLKAVLAQVQGGKPR